MESNLVLFNADFIGNRNFTVQNFMNKALGLLLLNINISIIYENVTNNVNNLLVMFC